MFSTILSTIRVAFACCLAQYLGCADASSLQVTTGVFVVPKDDAPVRYPEVTYWSDLADGQGQAVAAAAEGHNVSVEVVAARRIEFDGQYWMPHLQLGEAWFRWSCEGTNGLRLSIEAARRVDGSDDLDLSRLLNRAAGVYGCAIVLGRTKGGSLPGGEGRGSGRRPEKQLS